MAKPCRLRAISSVTRAYSRNPLERVASIGGVNSDHSRWSLLQPAAIELMEKGGEGFYYRVGEENVRLVVLTRDGEKYLQSEREDTHPDELLGVEQRSVVVAQPSRPRPLRVR